MAKEHGVITITVSGRKIPMRFCLWSLRQACRNLNMSLESFFDKFKDGKSEDGSAQVEINFFELTDFYAECFKEAANHELPDGAIPYQTKHAYAWLQELGIGSDQVKAAVQVLMESITFQFKGMDVPNTEPNAKKKPLTGRM